MNDQIEWQIEYLGFDKNFDTDNKQLKFLVKNSDDEKIIIMFLFSKELIGDNPEIFKDNACIKYALLHIKDAIQKNYVIEKINENERIAYIQINSQHVSMLKKYALNNLEGFFILSSENEDMYILKPVE